MSLTLFSGVTSGLWLNFSGFLFFPFVLQAVKYLETCACSCKSENSSLDQQCSKVSKSVTGLDNQNQEPVLITTDFPGNPEVGKREYACISVS